MSGVFGPGRPRDRHTRACGSEWSISKPARALRALRHPPRWLSMVLVFGRRALVGRSSSWWLGVVPAFRVPSGPAAREIATREPAARSGRSRSPPVPSGPYGTRHAGCPWCWCSAAVRLSAVARAGGLEWCLSVGCLRALRHPPCWLPVVLVPGQALPHQNPGVRP